MKAIGKVIEKHGNTAKVVSERNSACSMCHNCESHGMCHAELVFGEQTQSVEITALNTLGANIGDMVELESSTGLTLISAALIFVLPIVFSVLAYLISSELTNIIYLPAIVLVVTFFIVFFASAKLLNGYFRNKYTAQIIKIIEESEE